MGFLETTPKPEASKILSKYYESLQIIFLTQTLNVILFEKAYHFVREITTLKQKD